MLEVYKITGGMDRVGCYGPSPCHKTDQTKGSRLHLNPPQNKQKHPKNNQTKNKITQSIEEDLTHTLLLQD